MVNIIVFTNLPSIITNSGIVIAQSKYIQRSHFYGKTVR
jgi:hypothetical protein